jgi:hypothetical protein
LTKARVAGVVAGCLLVALVAAAAHAGGGSAIADAAMNGDSQAGRGHEGPQRRRAAARGARLDMRDKGNRDTDKVASAAAGHTWQAIVTPRGWCESACSSCGGSTTEW